MITEYDSLLKKIEEYQKQLSNPSLTDLQKSELKIKIGDLVDKAKRMTFHISMCEEDNIIE